MEPIASLSIVRLSTTSQDSYIFQFGQSNFSPIQSFQTTRTPLDIFETVPLAPDLQSDLQRRADLAVEVLRMLGSGPADQRPDDDALADVGKALYTHLLPSSIQAALKTLAPETPLLLATNDSGFPWELLHDGHEFLCLKRSVGRRLLMPGALPGSFAHQKTRRRALIIADPRGDLPAAGREGESLLTLFDTLGEDIEAALYGPVQATRAAAREWLSSARYDLIHFAGHAEGDALLLADGKLTADQISRELRGQPIIFLNACSTARENEINDLAGAFIRGGALAVVGTLWNIEDRGSIEFARWFYSHLLDGLPLGEALRRTRKRLRSELPGPLWAHYTLFGDPRLFVMGMESRDARQVTTLVARLSGLNALFAHLGLETAVGLQEKIIDRLSGLGSHFGGRTWTFMADRIPVLFGLPNRGEDDARRAIITAMEMVKVVNEFNAQHGAQLPQPLQIQLGISTGQVISSRIKTESGFDYRVSGNIVGIADTLAVAAQNQEILLDEATLSQAGLVFNYEPRQPLSLISGAAELPVYAVSQRLDGEAGLWREGRCQGVASFVGRDQELEELQRSWSEVGSGAFRLVEVIGPPGVGKTRLVKTFRSSLYTAGAGKTGGHIRWLRATCQEYEKESSYALLSQVVRGLTRVEAGVSEEEALVTLTESVSDALTAVMGTSPRLAELVPENVALLSQVLGFSFTVPSITTLDPNLRQKKLAAMIQALVQLAALNPFFLELEDLQWADDASLNVLKEIVAGGGHQPFLCLAIHRTDWSLPWADAHPRQIFLTELDTDSQRALLADILGTELEQRTAAQILAYTGGNPLFIEEMAQSLAESAVGVQPGGDLEIEQLPDRLETVIQARFDRLSSSALEVVHIASVLGQQFDHQLLSDMRDEAGRETLENDLNELRTRNIIEISGGFYPYLDYKFAHVIMQQVAYANILASRRRSLHRLAGRVLEASPSITSSPAAFAPLLAHHYFASDDRTRAIQWCIAAASRAADSWDNPAALLWYDRALVMLDSAAERPLTSVEQFDGDIEEYLNGQRLEVLKGAADVRWKSGDHDKAQANLNKALILTEAGSQFSLPVRADLYYRLVHVHEAQGDFDSAWEALQAGQKVLEGIETIEAGRLFIWRGLMHHRNGEPEKAIAWCRRGTAIAKAVDSLRDQAMGHNLLAIVYRVQGKLDLAQEAAEESLKQYEEEGFIPGVERATSNLACVYQDREKWQIAADLFTKTLELSKQTGEVYRQAAAYANLGEIARLQEEWETAVDWYDQGREMAQKHGLEEIGAILMMNMGAVMIAQGQPEEALQELAQSRFLFDEVKSRQYLSELARYRAQAKLALGNTAEAESIARQAVNFAEEMGQDSEKEAALDLLKQIRQER